MTKYLAAVNQATLVSFLLANQLATDDGSGWRLVAGVDVAEVANPHDSRKVYRVTMPDWTKVTNLKRYDADAASIGVTEAFEVADDVWLMEDFK